METTKGLHVGVNVDVECVDVKSWFNNPNTPLVDVIETGIIGDFAARDKSYYSDSYHVICWWIFQ